MTQKMWADFLNSGQETRVTFGSGPGSRS